MVEQNQACLMIPHVADCMQTVHPTRYVCRWCPVVFGFGFSAALCEGLARTPSQL